MQQSLIRRKKWEDLAEDEMVRRVYLGSNFVLRTSPQMKRQMREQEEREREEALRALGHVSQSNDDDDDDDDDFDDNE